MISRTRMGGALLVETRILSESAGVH